MTTKTLLICVVAAAFAVYSQAPAPQPAPPVPDYRMQRGDVVDVRFFYNPELNEQAVQIRPDGKISLQLAGDVALAGRTVDEVRQELEKTYAAQLKTPRITIQIRSYSSQKAFISGEVLRPGTVSLATSTSLIAALGEAGGISLRGNRNRVVLIRKMPDGSPGKREVQLFAAGRPTAGAMMPLEPFDVILVPESKIARVDRWVDQVIRQMIPLNLNAGFTYLWQKGIPQPNQVAPPVVAPF